MSIKHFSKQPPRNPFTEMSSPGCLQSYSEIIHYSKAANYAQFLHCDKLQKAIRLWDLLLHYDEEKKNHPLDMINWKAISMKACEKVTSHIAKASALQKAVLCKEKPCSCVGKAVSQVEAPFSWSNWTAFCRLVVSLESTYLESVDKFIIFKCLISCLLENCLHRVSAL